MIFAPKMSEIVVEFDSFDMEPDTTPPPGALCRYDWLEIWDGFPAGEEKEEGVWLGLSGGNVEMRAKLASTCNKRSANI